MKTMTCADLGGVCEQSLDAETWDEMVSKMTDHVVKNHPEVAEQMEEMHNQDPEKWGMEMKPKWDATPGDE